MSKTNRKALIILLVVILIIGAFLGLIGFIADFMWFKEMGYLSVFFKQLVTQLTVGVPTFIVITVLVYLYLGMLRKGFADSVFRADQHEEAEKNYGGACCHFRHICHGDDRVAAVV